MSNDSGGMLGQMTDPYGKNFDRAPTLADFLLARIAEDEGRARALPKIPPDPMNFTAGHVVMHPDRFLAECEAKRRIVEAVRVQIEDDDSHAWIVGSGVLLKALALPCADHPDYREEWRVLDREVAGQRQRHDEWQA